MITTARNRRAVRRVLATVVAAVITAVTWLGHVLALLGGAVDALVTALLGLPRVSYSTRRVADVIRETWEEETGD
ncbi:hypothetical protein FHU36_000275 [Nonomuraea muscovyensis]|uniref:Uncharacterized protein n=1 Tax=Nonomuraea muscovyensis TaxID=1124761 RepID=A0A7X0BYD8_9ACTN|nr:hypothetical protein [Nonomuraea muscovyensis]MBB6343766.1 hypothetical protein [Nonomuraea muscovyensis]